MIKAIIFDFAGVIGADGYWIWLRKNIPDIESKREYYQKISEQVDGATISNAEFVKAISDNSGISEDRIWKEIYPEIVINKELLNFIKDLKKKYRIGLLSNFTSPWLREIFNKHNLHEYFDEVIISSEHKLIKPDPAIFKKILKMLGVSSNEAVFIDDRQVHVDAANKLDIKGILFSSNQQLKDEFRELKLI